MAGWLEVFGQGNLFLFIGLCSGGLRWPCDGSRYKVRERDPSQIQSGLPKIFICLKFFIGGVDHPGVFPRSTYRTGLPDGGKIGKRG